MIVALFSVCHRSNNLSCLKEIEYFVFLGNLHFAKGAEPTGRELPDL